MLLSPALTRTTFQLTVDQVTPASFVDLEAEAADDGDESDDEESDEDGFVISEPVAGDREVSHTLMANVFSKESEQDEGWEGLLERARSRALSEEAHKDEDEPVDFIGLWRVAVRPGTEEQSAARLAAQLLRMENPPPVSSIIGRASLPGWIVFESRERNAVINACRSVNNFFVREAIAIEQVDAAPYLKEPPSFQPREEGWIRLKTKPYRHDLAYVHSVDERTLAFEAWVVPRMDFAAREKKRPRSKSGARPPKCLFDADLATRHQGPEAVSRRNRVVVLNDQYIFVEGLLSLSNPPHYMEEPVPTKEELLWFQGCSRVNRASINQALIAADRSEMKAGDVVKIVGGQSQGLCGTITMVRALEADVRVGQMSNTEAVPLSFLKKQLQIGDEAVVTDGMEAGFHGWVVGLWNDDVFMYNHSENREVKADITRVQLFLAPVHLAFAPEPSHPLDKFHVPNQHLVGKHVTIVNKSVWKDYEGIVKSVHSDGSALVEIQATMRQERLTMDLLKFGPGVIVHSVLGHSMPLTTQQLDIPLSKEPLHMSTPLPPAMASSSTSPAWDPSSRTPGIFGKDEWVDAPFLTGLRVQVTISGTKPVLRDPGWRNGDFEGRCGIIGGRDGGDKLKVMLGLHNTLVVPAQYLRPLRPCIAAQKAIALDGEFRGQCFVVVSIKDEMCVVRRPDDRKRKKDMITIPATYLTTYV